ncbi:MAG: class I SAM-dependent methyltransferase [Planctomycetes bacterium]|nr:class I SAM-dependent methyltransferase [Planctomycetota bacterium]MCB9919835.1 class I SAM-dependent methyltransferase [Planctomycetota bacterium]
MKRVPEVECMGTPEEAREYAAMDHKDANESFVAALLEHGCDRGEILDIGTGPADIPLLLVEKAKGANVTAIDLSDEMLKIARLKVAHAGHSLRIRLMHADAKGLPFADRHFDGVFSNTILHHVEDPIAYFKDARRVLRGGGSLVIRDLVRPDDDASVEKLVDRYAKGATEYARGLFRDSLKAAYTLDEVRDFLDRSGLDDASLAMTSDRHMTIWIDRR